jgi:hypothetical protein
VVRSAQVVRSSDTLSVPVADNGGFAAIACLYTPGRTTCDEQARPVPATAVTVDPVAVDAEAGSTFEVTGTFTVDSGVAREVRLTAGAPDGWTVSGPEVRRSRLGAGESVSGRWTVTVGAGQGFVDVPVFATFDGPGGPQWSDRVHVETAVEVFVPPPPLTGTPYVSDLTFVGETNGWGPIERDRSVNESDGGDGNPLTVGGVVYAKGLGTHAPASVSVYLGGRCRAFTSLVGLDDETTQPGSVTFQVLVDDEVRYDSGVVRPGPAVPVSVDTTGARMLTLRVTDGGDGKNFDHADWVDARLDCQG